MTIPNRLSDLNNHLFAQLERLGEEDLAGDRLTEEISRARAITDVAQSIIANGTLVLKARVAVDSIGRGNPIPPMLLE